MPPMPPMPPTPPTAFSPTEMNLRSGNPKTVSFQALPSNTTRSYRDPNPKRGRSHEPYETMPKSPSPPVISTGNTNSSSEDLLGRVNDIFSQIEKRLSQLVDARSPPTTLPPPLHTQQQCDETPPKTTRIIDQVLRLNHLFFFYY